MSLPRRRWLWITASGVTAASVIGALAWTVFASSLLAVRNIEVAGQSRLTETSITRAAGVRQGVPLALVDLEAVRNRVGNLRVVRSVNVSRAWPSTLRIEVHERTAVAAVPRGPGYVLLDEEGVRVATVPKPPDGLPIVRISASATLPARAGAGRTVTPHASDRASPTASPHAPDGADRSHAPDRATRGVASGDGASVSAAAERAALSVVSALPDGLARKVRAVSVSDDRKVTLYLRDGATVVWGPPERAQEKVRILRVLMRRHDATTYDVSSPEVVTTS